MLRLFLMLGAMAASLAGEQGGVERPPEFQVLVNSGNQLDSLPRDDLALIFLGKKTLWQNGTRILPAMMTEDEDDMRPFLSQVLHRDAWQFRAYWKRRLFSGGGLVPRTFRTSAEVTNFVQQNPGAIGVVVEGAETGRLRKVRIPDG